MKVSAKYVIEIRKFMMNFVFNDKDVNKGVVFDGKLTHDDMNLYLFDKKYRIPKRAKFNQIKKTDLLSGKILLIKDEIGKVIPYHNPRITNIEMLEEELHSLENKKRTYKARREFLKSQGYVETCRGDVIEKQLIDEEEDYITSKINRNKVLVNRNCHGMRGKVGLR